MQTEYLQEFIEVAHALSFSEAAKKLFVSQSALTRHIATLEKHLGAPLFIRTTRSVSLTDTGSELLQRLEPVMRNYHDAMEAIESSIAAKSKQLTIAFPYYFAETYLQDELTAFDLENPGVSCTLNPIEPPEAVPLLLRGACDVTFDTIFPFTSLDSRTVGRIVAVDDFCICVPQDHPLAKKKLIEVKDLNNQVFADVNDYPKFSKFMRAYFESRGISPRSMIYVDSVERTYHDLKREGAIMFRTKDPAIPPREGIAYVPLADNIQARICVVTLAEGANPLAKRFVTKQH